MFGGYDKRSAVAGRRIMGFGRYYTPVWCRCEKAEESTTLGNFRD